jgi:hypothetical protein
MKLFGKPRSQKRSFQSQRWRFALPCGGDEVY